MDLQIPNAVALLRRFHEREAHDRGKVPNVPAEAIERALARAASEGRVLAHYVLVGDESEGLALFRLGFGDPRPQWTGVSAADARRRLSRLIASALADPHLGYEAQRAKVGDLRFLRRSLEAGSGTGFGEPP